MDLYAIPIENKVIIYRPLAQLAFVGNMAMTELVQEIADNPAADIAPDVRAYLETIGFFQPDSPPPAPIEISFRPATAVLLLTNRCNLRCTYCYADAGVGEGIDLSMEVAIPVIDAACQNAIAMKQPWFELVFHGGGEPMQAWQTIQGATAYARSKRLPCRVSMVSNGLWSKAQRDWILNNFDNVSISFDGRPTTQDRQRPMANGQPSSTAVLRTLGALDDASFDYGIRLTATSPWRETLPEDIRFICENSNCQIVHVEPAFNTLRGQHQPPDESEVQAFIEGFMAAYEIAGQYRRQLVYSGARLWLTTNMFCKAPYDALIANAHGELVTCYEIASEDHHLSRLSTIGQVRDGEIYVDNNARVALHERLAEKRASCRECFAYYSCAGDCYARTLIYENGDFHGIDSRCQINRGIITRLLLHIISGGNGLWHRNQPQSVEIRLMRQF